MHTNKSFAKTLERARQMGEGEDKILAHIHPIEAEELRRKYGGNINPHTGLPQYGFKIPKFIKNVARVALPIVGHMIAGPVGAAIGGGAGRAATSQGNVFKNFGRGALPAAALSAGASIAGGGLNLPFLQGGNGFFGFQGPQDGFMGQIFGRGPGSVINGLSNFGGGMFPGSGYPSQAMKSVPRGTGYSAGDMQQEEPGLMQKLGGGARGIMDSFGGPLPASLMAASLFALSKKKDKIIPQPRETYHNPFPDQGGPAREAKPLRRRLRTPRELEHETDEHPGVWFDEVNPATEHYAQGGAVRGHGGGAADNIDTGVKPNTFIWDATDVSLLGDGNTENGFHKLNEFEQQLLNSRYAKNAKVGQPRPSQDVKIRISSGEYRMDPLAVAALGHMKGGDINTGIKAIKDIRNNLKTQKGLAGKKIPPKSKPIMQYMRG